MMGYADFQHIYNDFYPYNCAWCGDDLTKKMKNPDQSMGDHWKPRSKGGVDATLPCCPNCNSTRQAKSPLTFIRYCKECRKDIWRKMIQWHFRGRNELSSMVQRVRDELAYPDCTMNTHYKIVNIKGTSKNLCACSSWIEHWRKTTEGTRTTCAVIGCGRKDVVGAHVHIEDDRYTRHWWIVPLCRSHNHVSHTEPMFIDSRTSLASANIGMTCCR